MKTELQEYICKTFLDLRQTLSLFTDKQLNLIPFAGSWTGGQTGEHMVKFLSAVPEVCSGKTQGSTRPADEKGPAIKKLFLDLSQKFDSPEFIKPGEQQHSVQNLLSSFQELESEFTKIVDEQDLSLLCLDLELPGFGTLTKREWIEFALAHARRHIEQLRSILKTSQKQNT